MTLIRKIKLFFQIKKLKRIIKAQTKPPITIPKVNGDKESFSLPPFVPYKTLGLLKLTEELLDKKRKEQYEAALEEAKKAKRPCGDDGTSYSLQLNLPEGETLLTFLAKQRANERTFVDMLIFYAIRENIDYKRIYTFAHIDRRLFSKIISDRYYHPSKDTALALTLALQLNIGQAEMFLESAGYTLSKSIPRDIVIKFLIENKIYDLDDVNTVLYEIGEKTLGR